MNQFRGILQSPNGGELQDLSDLRSRLVNIAMLLCAIFGAPAVSVEIFRASTVHAGPSTYVSIVAYLAIVAGFLFRRRFSLRFRAVMLILLLAGAALMGLVTWGLFAGSFLTLFSCAVLIAILFGLRWAYLFSAFVLFSLAAIGWGFATGWLRYRFGVAEHAVSITPWMQWIASFAVLSAVVVYAVAWVNQSLQKTIESQKVSEIKLQKSNELLQAQAVTLEKQARRMEEQAERLREQRDEAEAGSRSKDQFLSVISHELRTPLNPVMGFLELIQKDPGLSSDSAMYLKLMKNSSEQLLRMIDDVVDYSELEHDELAVHRIETNVSEIAQEAESLLRPAAEAKGLAFQLTREGEADARILLDKRRALQVIGNLGDNAIKFTREGGVSIRLMASRSFSDEMEFGVVVTDTGIGIGRESLEALFDPFVQADGTKTRREGGLGLGLAMCKRILDAMDGSIDVESQAGEGACFEVRIPVEEVAEPSGGTGRKESDVDKLRFREPIDVLVVEDEFVNQRVVSALLKRLGASVSVAMNGLEAIRAVEERRFDAVLMDVSMPEMDGITATREIRKLPRFNRVPIIALTAHSHANSRQDCFNAGMDGFLTKPVRAGSLFDEIERIVFKDSVRNESEGF